MVISIILFIVCVLMLLGTQITMSPFKISFSSWQEGLSLLIVMIGFAFYGATKYAKGYKNGLDRGAEIQMEALKDIIDSMASNKIDTSLTDLPKKN